MHYYSANYQALEIAGLSAALETNGVAFLIEDVNRNVVHINQNFCTMFNLIHQPSVLVGSNVLHNALTFSKKFINHRQVYNTICQLPTQNFTNKIWQLVNGETIEQSFFCIQNKQVTIGYVWQYTLPKKQEQANGLKANYTIQNNWLNALPQPIAILNKELKIVFANEAFVPYKYLQHWVFGKTMNELYARINRTEHQALEANRYIQKCLDAQQQTCWEQQVWDATTAFKKHITYHAFFVKNEGNDYCLVQAIDNTALKNLELKLNNALEQYIGVINASEQIIFQTNSDLVTELSNKTYNTLFSNNSKLQQIIPLKNYEFYKQAFEILLGEAKSASGKINLLHNNTQEKTYNYQITPNFMAENVNSTKGILINLNDTTQQVAQETQLLELVKRQKELNELKTTFVNMVSHELRTPLTVISSSAEILNLLIDAGKSKDELTVYTLQIIEEVEKMTAFMQDILMISKIEAGKIQLQAMPTDVSHFVHRIANENFKPWKDGRECSVTIKRCAKAASIDTKMIGHVLENILQNAFKYSAGRAAPSITVNYATTYFTITVTDEGIGIPAQDMPNLFTAFFRAGNTSNIPGTGIGLQVVKYFTEQHGGYVAVKSKAGKGSIFMIKLPYEK